MPEFSDELRDLLRRHADASWTEAGVAVIVDGGLPDSHTACQNLVDAAVGAMVAEGFPQAAIAHLMPGFTGRALAAFRPSASPVSEEPPGPAARPAPVQRSSSAG